MPDCRNCPDFFDCPQAQPQGTARPLVPKAPKVVKVETVAAGHFDRNGQPVVDFLGVLVTAEP